tara:strand:- start:20222 stop:20467 length:246 start_codon:yes stop_codon:yes gene_type:complete
MSFNTGAKKSLSENKYLFQIELTYNCAKHLAVGTVIKLSKTRSEIYQLHPKTDVQGHPLIYKKEKWYIKVAIQRTDNTNGR